jgi:hypothetical protein
MISTMTYETVQPVHDVQGEAVRLNGGLEPQEEGVQHVSRLLSSFYHTVIHGDIPTDTVSMLTQAHARLIPY